MKPLTDKFANISRPGIARQIEKAGRVQHIEVEAPRPRAQSPSASLGTTPPAKPKFDRTAYQREYMKEYMRKRRAKHRDAGK